ncbi:hypothetical protein Pcinc_010782 [Petrolisthes cinctipes]|uniref:Uncharacterized protein n=1 Tax=Petrolisthes cinctipes TaxID=88211 RepID=A0AAE1G259_PETCI|nr:hypothetical protein Pcinc_010782 [Petrolisthes cinctipes]
MNFFSSEEDANRLLNFAHYLPSSPHARNGSSPRKRPSFHISTTEEDSATLAPAKKQRQDATLNDISSLLLQFAQRFDKLESDMYVVKGSNSQLQQDRANLKKGKSNLPFSSSSSSSEDEDDDLPPAAQSASSLPSSQLSPSPPPYSPGTYSVACSLSPSLIYSPTPILNPSQGTIEERYLPASPSAIQHPAPGSPMLPQPQPQTAPTAIPAEPDSPPDPAAIT